MFSGVALQECNLDISENAENVVYWLFFFQCQNTHLTKHNNNKTQSIFKKLENVVSMQANNILHSLLGTNMPIMI